MKGDFSRQTFVPPKHYADVLAQMGRVLLDSEFNERGAIFRHRMETEARDVIGARGVPKSGLPLAQNPSFRIQIQNGDTFVIGPGRIYVDGILCENEAETAYNAQPDFALPPDAPAPLQLLTGNEVAATVGLVYLDVWEKLVTAREDARIREVALGGPDTTARVRTAWAVRVLPLPSANAGTATCADDFPELAALAPGTGRMDARVEPNAGPPDPCEPMPTSGFLGLENQLYRVEVHQGGGRAEATFKWSRDNGSVVTTITQVTGAATLIATDLGRDAVLGFKNDDWVEVTDDLLEAANGRGELAQIQSINPATREITLKANLPALDAARNARMRRWDMPANAAVANGVAMNAADADWVNLENDIQAQFSDGAFKAGDYWLIPARAAAPGGIEWPPYPDPGVASTMQLPEGVRHHLCPLALLRIENEALVALDCRDSFPTLTGICAEDVCFDDAQCQLGGVTTVQEAIDRLCRERDLRFHNKHLHGWGIVCGLQVHCGPDDGETRRRVSVRSGYALDCDGNDILINESVPLDILQMIADANAADPNNPLLNGDGEVCLAVALDEAEQPQFRLHRYTPAQNKMQEMLKGSLLMDFYNDCIQSLVDFFKEQTTPQPGEENLPVGPTQKRITTLLNLLIQLFNPANGQFVFLSEAEDGILREFYAQLRALLQSATFCAMFENARPFPDYPDVLRGPSTLFGKGFPARVRVHPTQRLAFTVGAGNKIHVYDLDKGELTQEVEFPGGADSVVQDVAFSEDGTRMFAVGLLSPNNPNADDSVFATATIARDTFAWSPISALCDVQIVTLGTIASRRNLVYAIGKNKGLYEINPDNVAPNPVPLVPFNAVGHLELVAQNEQPFAYATRSQGAASTDSYDSFLRKNLNDPAAPPEIVTLIDPTRNNAAVTGQDGMTLVPDTQRGTLRLAIVGNPPANGSDKRLLSFPIDSVPPDIPAVLDGLENTGIALAHNPLTGFLMLAFADSYRVGLVDLRDNRPRIVDEVRFPVQITPTGLAVWQGAQRDPALARVLALNRISNTLTSYDAAILEPNRAPGRPPDNTALAEYRRGILEAYADLLGGLLQYLKDCFCDHLLVDCPTCDPAEDRIYLACVSIRGNEVYKVCNFSLRRHVVTFPTLGYWMSVVPLIPMLKEAVSNLCCAVLPDLFGKFQVPAPAQATTANRISSNTMQQGVTMGQKARRGSILRAPRRTASEARAVTTRWLDSPEAPRAAQPETPAAEVANQPVERAREGLRARDIVVDEVRPFDRSVPLAGALKFAVAPDRLPAGSRVTLFEENGVVRYYTVNQAPTPEVADLRERVNAQQEAIAEVGVLRETLTRTQAEVAARDTQLTDMRRQLDEQTAARDTRIAALESQLRERLTERDSQIADLRNLVQAQVAERDRQFTEMQTRFTELQTRHTEIAGAVTPERLTQLQDELATLRTQVTTRLRRDPNR